MQEVQIKQIYSIIAAAFQTQLKSLDSEAYYNTLVLFLKDKDYMLVAKNLKKHIDNSSFVPTIADLCKVDEEKDLLEKSLIESQKYISMIEEEERNIKPKSEKDLQKIKELKEKMNKLQRDGRKRYDERIAKLFEQ